MFVLVIKWEILTLKSCYLVLNINFVAFNKGDMFAVR